MSNIRIIVYVGGRVVGNSNNPTYEGGRPFLIEVPHDSSLASLKQLIQDVAATPPGLMKITYCYPIVSHPHPISYIGVEVVDDDGVNTIFNVANATPGYTPTLYTESVKHFPEQYDIVPVHTSSRRRSKGESSRHRQSINNAMSNFTDERDEVGEDSTFADQHEYGAVGINNEFEFHLGDGDNEDQEAFDEDVDYASTSSEEDVDAGLETGDDEEDSANFFEPPSMLTQDTWTNIIDPSPPMATSSQTGWDGSEFIRGQMFSSKEEVKYSVQKYSMDRNCTVKTEKSSPNVLVYRCNNEIPCLWRLRAVKITDIEDWQITRYAGPHNCISRNVSQDHVNLTARYMVRHITPILQKDASTKIKVLQEIIKIATQSYNPLYAKTWAAKTHAIAAIYGNWDESYAELPRYLAEVKLYNPGTEYVINTTESNIPGCAIFSRVFWAFGPAIEAFKHCRPVLSVDGTFLKGKYKGMMLIAVTQDAENEIIPIAFAIVEKEDTDNWGWFLSCIRCFVTMRTHLCLISDRAPGLMSYMPTDPLWRPPYVYHRYCARHIGANYMRRYNKRVGMQVKVTAMEGQKQKYKRQLSKMINWDDGKVHKDLMDLDLPKWSLAYDGGRRYGSCTTNVSESLNGVLKEARHLPITATVMTTFYKSVEYFFSKVERARQRKENDQTFSKFAMDKFEDWMKKARRHRVMQFDRQGGVYEVETPMHPTNPYKGNHKHTIRLVERKCTCGKFQQWKMPCSHVIAVCMKIHVDVFQYFDDVWTLDSNIAIYGSQPFFPIRDRSYWPPNEGPTILPNQEWSRGRGRPQIKRFRNEMDLMESQPSQTQTCTFCGQQGHNKRTCSRVRGQP